MHTGQETIKIKQEVTKTEPTTETRERDTVTGDKQTWRRD